MENPKFKFEELTVYQESLDFVDDVYSITQKFPKDKSYGLTSQYKRASVSIPLNIAEGAGDTDAQFNRYLQMRGILQKNVSFAQQLQKGKDS